MKTTLFALTLLTMTQAFAALNCELKFEEPIIVKRIKVKAPIGTTIDTSNIPANYIVATEDVNANYTGRTTRSAGFSEVTGYKEGTVTVAGRYTYTEQVKITNNCNQDIFNATNGARCVRDLDFRGSNVWTAMLMLGSNDTEGGVNMLMGDLQVEEINGELQVALSAHKDRSMASESQYSSSEAYFPTSSSTLKFSTGSIVNNFGVKLTLDCK